MSSGLLPNVYNCVASAYGLTSRVPTCSCLGEHELAVGSLISKARLGPKDIRIGVQGAEQRSCADSIGLELCRAGALPCASKYVSNGVHAAAVHMHDLTQQSRTAQPIRV